MQLSQDPAYQLLKNSGFKVPAISSGTQAINNAQAAQTPQYAPATLGDNTTQNNQQQQQQTPYVSPEEQARRAQEAEDNRIRGERKNTITNLVNSIRGVYDALYGDVGTAAADSTNRINQRYGTENKGLADQFQTQFRDIGNAFSARGTYDSSYRGDSERSAQEGYQNLLEQQRVKQQGELGEVGKYVSEARAQIGGDKEALSLIQQQLPNTNNLDELQQLVNQLQARKNEANVQRAGAGTQNVYLQQLQGVNNRASKTAQLRAQLSNVVAAEVPGAVKGSVIQNLINGAQLSAQEKEQLLAEYGALVTTDEEQTA